MYHPLSLFIGLRYTRSKRNNRFVSFITLFSTAGITIGVLALITVLSVMNGFEQDLKVRILGAVPHVIVTPKTDAIDAEKSLSALANDPLVAAVTPFLQADAMVQSKSEIQGAQLQGIDPSSYPQWDVIRQNMLIGDISLLQPGKYNIIIGRSMAKSLNVKLGDKIRLISTKGSVFTPMGRVPSQRKFTVVGIYSVGSDVEATQVLVNITDAGKLARLKPSRRASARMARSRLTREPSARAPTAVQSRVSRTASKLISSPSSAITVKHAPSTAMLSPRPTPSTTAGASTRRQRPSPLDSIESTSPTVSTIPVNIE